MTPLYEYYWPLYPGDGKTTMRKGHVVGVPDEVRYIVVIGGRGSAKSHHVSDALVCHSDMDSHDILFTRYTMTSAKDSIIPEFVQKIDDRDKRQYFDVKSTLVRNVRGGKILFKGIVANGRNQTAKLKSIPNLKIFVMDEAEELANETTFDTVDFSLRQQGVHALLWLVLNPTDVRHWIYTRFIKPFAHKLKPNSVNIFGDTCIIWTTYEINPYLDDAFLAKAESMKEKNPKKYDNIFRGYWLAQKEGLIYKNWHEITADQYPSTLPQWWGMDWGYTDWPNAIVRMCYDPAKGDLYLMEVPTEGKLTRDAAKAVIRDGEALGYAASDCEAYCDPARPENIAECRTIYDISALPGVNRDKTGRIHYLQGFRVFYVGEHIKAEVESYSWKSDPHNEALFLDVPQDGGDHYMDAISYGATRLRRMGVNGEEG